MKRLISICLLSISLVACAPKAPPPPPQPTYLDHVVQYSGETMGVIAAWYTGSSANWPLIANANPQIQVKNIRIGNVIRIPENLVVKREPLTQEFLSKSGSSGNSQLAKSEAHEAMPATEPSADTQVTTITTADGSTITASGDVTLKEIEPPGKNPNEDLLTAVFMMDKDRVAAALAAGADPSYVKDGRAVLGWAAQNGDVSVVNALIEAKANLNHVDGVGHTPLMRAADTGQVEVLKALAKAGADLNVKEPHEGRTALFLAAASGHEAIVKALLEAGADPNILDSDGDSVVLIATQYGYAGVVKALAEGKAELNRSNIVYTPLSYAVEQSNKEMIEVLLNAGADPNAKTEGGRTPLIIAIDNPDIFQLLLDKKADPNLANGSGETPLMVAVQNGNTDAIERLIKAGANVNAKGSDGTSALTVANNMFKQDMVELLKKHGAVE